MDDLDQIIEDIRDREEEKEEAAQRVRDATRSFDMSGIVEDTLLTDVERAPLNDTTVAGVDGGLVRQELHGIDVILVRAVAALFTYQDGRLDVNRYHPSATPQPRVEYSTRSMARHDVDRLSSLYRLREEVQRAGDVAENGLDLLLMDGSILPQYPDKPSRDSDMLDEYEQVMAAYISLYERAVENDVLLAGVVEDTRSSTLCTVMQDNGVSEPVLESCRDSHFLHYLLETGERTLVMEYAHNEHHPILSDLSGHGDHIYSFYLKPVKHDRPIRIDIYAPDNVVETAETVASHVYALSGAHQAYGIPSVLIEADKRAKIKQHEISLALDRIQSKLGHTSGVEELRRNRRPF